MLAILGAVEFNVFPLNYDSLSTSSASSHAAHEVPGSSKVFEHTGEADRTITIKGKIFPQFAGGVGEMAMLEAMRASGEPQHLMLSSGFPAGWVIIKTIATDHSHIGFGGIGREIGFTLTLERCDVPVDVGDLMGALLDGIINAANEYL